MAELENERWVCEVCHKERFRFEFDRDVAGYAGEEKADDICCSCIARFLDDCLEGWLRKERESNEIIGGYRRADLAYHDEDMWGGPSVCERCGDRDMDCGHRGYIVFPDGKHLTLCYSCCDDWEAAADVEEDEFGQGFMSPAAVAAFQWRGVEGFQARQSRQGAERRAVKERQGGVCADCGHKPTDHRDYLVAWPPDQPDGFRMVCKPCRKGKTAAAGVEA